MSGKRDGSLEIVLSMIIFGTIGILRRSMNLPSAFIACARGLIGSLGLYLAKLASGKKEKLELFAKTSIPLLISGALMGVNWILLFEAYRFTSVAVATLCYYMAPVLVICISPVLFKEKLTLNRLVCVVVAVVGILLVSGVADVSDFSAKGVLLGLGAAVLYASVICITKTAEGSDNFNRSIIQLLAAGITVLPYSLIVEKPNLHAIDGKTAVLLAVACLVHTALAYLLYFTGIVKTTAQKASLLSYLDPIVAVILSATILNETMTVPMIIGSVMLISSMVLLERK